MPVPRVGDTHVCDDPTLMAGGGVYVNQTGLMWELAPSFGALIVFAEHRCEPSSVWKMCGQQAVEDPQLLQ